MLETEGFISKILSQNLSAISEESLRVQVGNLDFGHFQSEAENIKTGRFILVYTETDCAVMSVLLPETAQKILFKKLSKFDGEEKNDSVLTKLLNLIVGNLPYLCSVKKNGIENNFLTLQKPYRNDLKDQLLWDVSECNIFRCSVIGAVFYLSLNIELQKEFEKLFKTDSAFKKTLIERALNNKVSEYGISAQHESDIKISVKNPLEFIVGNCFLPREAHIGKKDVSVVFKKIIAAEKPASQINKGMIWYRFLIIKGGIEYSVYYCVDVKSREKKHLQFFNSLFTALVKKAAIFLRAQSGFERINGKIVSSPVPEDVENAIILTADIKWGNNIINTQIFVSSPFISDYLSSILEAWEVESLKNNKKSLLLNLISVNSTIFGKSINTFYYQTGLELSKGEILSISVSKILALLDTNNAGRLVQNYFLSGGSSLDEFRSLFLYRYYVEGEEVAKIGRDALFNKEEYKKYIPKALHSDWDLCSGSSANYEELLDLNEKALKGIYKAMQEDKLLMPYKVYFILYNVFQKPLNERFELEIKKLIEVTPWQNLIEKIPKKTGQQLISSTPTSKLGIALVPGRPTVKELAHLMSKTKRSELDEELRINTKKYELGSLSSEKIFLALEEVLDILNQLAIPDDERI